MGREATALLSTLLALGVLSLMPWIIKRLEREEQAEMPEHSPCVFPAGI
jgi:putative Mg2+ transporter-C (MgtC) family protein